MSKEECTVCQSQVSSWDDVWLGDGKGHRFLCSRCYNESIAALVGLDYEHVNFEPASVQDLDGVTHTFVFRIHLIGDRIAIEAHEDGPQDGYEFLVVEDAEQDLFITFGKLFERSRRDVLTVSIDLGFASQRWQVFVQELSDAKLDDATKRYLFAVFGFGFGCNLGVSQITRHAPESINRHSMRRINAQHVNVEKLEAALRDIIHEYAA